MTSAPQTTTSVANDSARRGRDSSTPLAARGLILIVAASAIFVILRSVPLVGLPYEIDFGEGLMLEGGQRLLNHQPLYPSPYGFPVVLHDWGPVTFAVATLAFPGGHPSLPAGRITVVIFSLLLSILIGLILKRWTGRFWTGLGFGLLLLTLPAFRFWLYLWRIDVIAVVFSVIGILLYSRDERRWPWAVPWFALAIFCKYTLVAAPVAVFVHLLLKRRIRGAMGFAASLGLVCLVAFAALQVETDGWFAFHMFSTHSDPYSFVQFLGLAGLVWLSAPVATGLALWQVVRDFRDRRGALATLYFVGSSLTSLSAGQLGSTTNHFLEWMVAACLCAGLAYSEFAAKAHKRLVPITVLLALSVLLGVVVQSQARYQPDAGLAECGPAYATIRNAPSKAVLAQSPGPLVVAGKSPIVSDPFVYTHLVRHGRWPDNRIEQLVNDRYFDLIVMGEDPSVPYPIDGGGWPEALRAAIAANYRVAHRYVCRDASVMLEPISPPAGNGRQDGR